MDKALEVLDKINTLRNKPKVYLKTLNIVSKAMKRVKKTSLARELEEFAHELGTKEPINPLVLSPSLCQLCEEELAIMIREKKESTIKDYNELKAEASKIVKGFKKIYMAFDNGGIDFIIARMCISEYDPKRLNKKNFLSEDYSYIGVAQCDVPGTEEEEANVIMLADFVDEKNMAKFYFDDFTDLRKAFNCFDVNKSGTLDPKELKQNLRSLNYDKDCPFEWSIIEKLDTPDNNKNGINFRTFSLAFDNALGDVHTDDGIRRIFDAFKNDQHQEHITSTSIKKLYRSLDIPVDNDEIDELINKNCINGKEITYPEFFQIVKEYYDIPENSKKNRRGTIFHGY